MGNFFCRLFAPWKAEGCFDELDDFYDFLLRRNRALNAFEPQPYNFLAVGALVLALGLSLVIIQNEKQLPPELQNPKS